MYRLIPFLVLSVFFSCQSTSSLNDADRLFLDRKYLQAHEAYSSLEIDQDIKSQRLEITSYFLLEDYVRELVNTNRSMLALELLPRVRELAPQNRSEILDGLERRCNFRIAREYYDSALAFSEIGDKPQAIRELVKALTWREDYPAATEMLNLIKSRELARNARGEELYLEGLEEINLGNSTRARTAFLHAANRLTDPALAEARLAAMSQNLAEESLRQAKAFLKDDQIGPAWVAVQDAIYLGEDFAEAIAISEDIDAFLISDAFLDSANIALLGNRFQLANEFIEAAAEQRVQEHAERLVDFRERQSNLHQQSLYVRARAFEADSQLMRASLLYQDLLDKTAGFGYQDASKRADVIAEALLSAEMYYEQAMLAEENGDLASYKDNLAAVLRITIDYEDTFERFATLLSNEAVVEDSDSKDS